MPQPAPDVAVAGGGLIGLACALALADRGVRTLLVDARLPGEASPAAAGMLAPGVERATGAAHDFALASRDRYPAWVAALEERTGHRVALDRQGVLELLPHDDPACTAPPPGARLLEARELARLEPALAHAPAALLHERDGAVDNVALLAALRAAAALAALRIATARAVALERRGAALRLRLADGGHIEAGCVVLAAGAWSAALAGLPRPLPVEPVRGQMLALGAAPLSHVTYARDAYAVPRAGGITAIGATMERVGFAPAVTPEGQATLLRGAAALAPALGTAPVVARWSGLRPVTPDLLPILGPDPDIPSLIYACGHSRNGILMAPATAACVAALACGEAPPHALQPFRIERFA